MYEKLAYYYDMLGWREQVFSSLTIVNTVLCKFNIIPEKVCDTACGTGEFIKQYKKIHYVKEIIGVDISEDMLNVAKKKNKEVEFIQDDMRTFRLEYKVNLITCLYDSINHLLTKDDWEKAFKSIKTNLTNNGIFIMDLVPKDALKKWEGNYVLDKKNCVLVRSLKYNDKTNTLTSSIVGFIKNKLLDIYSCVREEHIETSFDIKQIKKMLSEAGFKKIYLCDENGNMYKYFLNRFNTKSRVYFVCK